MHTFAGRGEVESLSPFCMKVEVYLKLVGLPYRAIAGDPRKAPKGKLPFIVDGEGACVADSDAIIAHLERGRTAPLDGGLDADARMRGHLAKRTLEESLYFVMLWSRWAEPSGWDVVRHFFDELPTPLRWVVPRLVRKKIIGSAYAFLANILLTGIPSPLEEFARAQPGLVRYVERMAKRVRES